MPTLQIAATPPKVHLISARMPADHVSQNSTPRAPETSMNRRLTFSILGFLLILTGSSVRADVTLPSIIGDGMVLQQKMAAPIWGWADPGENVTVSFNKQSKATTADQDGKWMIKLDPMNASKKGQSLNIKGNNSIHVQQVLVGEVWICSGQSNMEWSVANSLNAKEEIAAADHPMIHLFNVPGHTTSDKPKEQCPGQWEVCSPQSIRGFSAVGYFFGRRLNEELNVPIGLVGSNWGGTRIEPWVSLDGFRSVPELSKQATEVEKLWADGGKVGSGTPSAIYNAMIHPLAPYAMRGGIWYQGESNGNEGISYHHKKTALINGWRKLFNPDLAFYWVQLADFRTSNEKPEGGDGWAKLRDAQRTSLNIDNTGMAVIHDIGNAKDIHPRNKQDVGWRLSQWALNQNYGRNDLVPAGPLYKSHKVENNSIRLTFDHIGKGLMVGKKDGLDPAMEDTDGTLGRFAVAGEDKVWHWADAVIDGDNVLVSSKEVTNPVAVRYGYTMNPRGANLYNKDGIPASPFRTDTW
ncbi:MAG: sialate O-acetylesterase [Rhodopirellula sp.]|nr:sialate O-acetylesterase [Rhodopirellula sp.]